jgi:hypothetical protein
MAQRAKPGNTTPVVGLGNARRVTFGKNRRLVEQDQREANMELIIDARDALDQGKLPHRLALDYLVMGLDRALENTNNEDLFRFLGLTAPRGSHFTHGALYRRVQKKRSSMMNMVLLPEDKPEK